ncbi:MAG: PKD domain-containing protein [Bacteroidia bacterium]|nr:PKD domain-containing protein [Bacteroidia bacterium]
MKKLLFSLIFIISGIMVFAQVPPLVVTGQVTDQNGGPVPDQQVFISFADSTGPVGPPVQVFMAITDNNGDYSATINVNYFTSGLYIVYTFGNCSQNTYYSQYVQSSVQNAVVNFQICIDNNPPSGCVAGFSYYPEVNMICPGGGPALTFVNNSQSSGSVVSYQWTFGNFDFSSDENPSECFMMPGFYQVCLTITSADGCTDTYCESVYAGDSIINPPGCQADFWYSNPSNTSQNQFYDASSGNPDTWNWSFGDGTSSTEQNPVHIYQMTGSYFVCLTISSVDPDGNITCTSTYCDSIYYQGNNQSACQAYYSTDPNSVYCFIGWGMAFIDESYSGANIDSWYWDFGNGNISTDQNPDQCFNDPGTYQVCLTITAGTCTDTYCQYLSFPDSINYDGCHAAFYYNGISADGGSQFIDVSTGGAMTWHWDFGDGTSSTDENPVHLFPAEGYYNVCLTIHTASGCIDQYCLYFYFNSNPQGNCQAFFSYGTNPVGYSYWFMNQTYVINGVYTSNWNFGDGSYSTNQNPVHTYTLPGTYEVCLNIISSDSCTETYCHSIIVGAGNYTVSGNVYANGVAVNNCAVLLMGQTGSIYAGNVSDGYYEFGDVVADTYIIYAIPSYVSYPGYIPTYYQNAIYWTGATQVIVNEDITGADINLIQYNWVPSGGGIISGNVFWPNDSIPVNSYKDRLDHSVAGIAILLMNMNDSVLMYSSTDINGYFDFKTLPFGTYKIYTELTGHITYPAIVTLDNNSNSVTGIQIVITGTTIIVGINEMSDNIHDALSVYPNPVKDLLNLTVNSDISGTVKFSIMNTLGQVVYYEELNLHQGTQTHSISVADLPHGMYYVLIDNDQSRWNQKKFIK